MITHYGQRMMHMEMTVQELLAAAHRQATRKAQLDTDLINIMIVFRVSVGGRVHAADQRRSGHHQLETRR